jgi:hypothetical protein
LPIKQRLEMKDLSTYSGYTVVELLNDDYFLDSERTPTEDSRKFWEELESHDGQLRMEIAQARDFLNTVSLCSGKKMASDDVDDLWKRIECKNANLKKTHKKREIFYKVMGVAACLAILVVCTIWLDKMTSVPSAIDSIMAVKRPSGGTNTDIQLILSEKENLKIAGKESQLKYTKNGKFSINSNVEQKLDDGEDTYNQLIVPAGKRSSIIFSDGTRMDVNANTRVVYPVVFSHNKREIYVEGEVYLQVSPDKSRPFIVRTDRMDVQVLGTAFDVCTNPDRTLSTVVLVHGKVWVQTSDKQQKILNPGEMLSYIENNEIGVRNVDVSEYISWAEGYYEFHKEPIRNIVNKLTRYYGKKIAIASELLNITFSGKLDLRDDLQDVLESIAGTMPADVITTKDGGYQLGRD